jgi:demethylspheroidene O-methyltransferase
VAGEFLFNLRNRLLSSASFRSFAEKVPIFQRVARKRAFELFAMAGGFIHSQVLASCVRLGLFEMLRNGALPINEIAARTGIPGARLGHLLRAAAALRLLDARAGERYGLGELGAAMVDNPSLDALVAHHELLYKDLADPVSMFSGEQDATHMQQLWPYATAGRPDDLSGAEVDRYTDLMASSQAMIADQVLGAYSMRQHQRLMDIGGGAGAFLMRVHERWPDLDLTLVDLPAVAEIAHDSIARAGLEGVIEVVGADAVKGDLPGGFDLVSLVRILHDHDDDVVRALLTAAYKALAADGVLVIAEPLADAPGAGRLIDAYFNVYLLAMGSGRPRSFAEIRRFLEDAGFREVRLRRTRIPLVTSVITAKRT